MTLILGTLVGSILQPVCLCTQVLFFFIYKHKAHRNCFAVQLLVAGFAYLSLWPLSLSDRRLSEWHQKREANQALSDSCAL